MDILNLSQIIPDIFWPLIFILIIFAVTAFVYIVFFGKSEEEMIVETFPYEKKPFVFDAISELNLYRLLLELFGDKYYIFPQVVYSRLVQLKRGESLKYRTHFDKKIADFVLCDKEKAIAQLVIELDGSSHESERRIERDAKVDLMMKQIGLPILHIKTQNMEREFVKGEVNKYLPSIIA